MQIEWTKKAKKYSKQAVGWLLKKAIEYYVLQLLSAGVLLAWIVILWRSLRSVVKYILRTPPLELQTVEVAIAVTFLLTLLSVFAIIGYWFRGREKEEKIYDFEVHVIVSRGSVMLFHLFSRE